MKNYLLSRLQAIPWPPQLRDAIHSPWLPLALLLLALSTVFIFANDRGAFYRPGHHDVVTADFLSSTAVISPEQRFQSFFCRFRSVSGFTCAPYNRFPLGGYLLVKLFVLPFPDDLSAQIYSARILMLLAYAGAALLAYLSLCRLTGHRWIALIATLSVFASPYWLYYNDMVFFFGPSLFGVMLTFHAMVIFIQEGRFRQLLLKSCLALFLGWHSLALLLTFPAGLTPWKGDNPGRRRQSPRRLLRPRQLPLPRRQRPVPAVVKAVLRPPVCRTSCGLWIGSGCWAATGWPGWASWR